MKYLHTINHFTWLTLFALCVAFILTLPSVVSAEIIDQGFEIDENGQCSQLVQDTDAEYGLAVQVTRTPANDFYGILIYRQDIYDYDDQAHSYYGVEDGDRLNITSDLNFVNLETNYTKAEANGNGGYDSVVGAFIDAEDFDAFLGNITTFRINNDWNQMYAAEFNPKQIAPFNRFDEQCSP